MCPVRELDTGVVRVCRISSHSNGGVEGPVGRGWGSIGCPLGSRIRHGRRRHRGATAGVGGVLCGETWSRVISTRVTAKCIARRGGGGGGGGVAGKGEGAGGRECLGAAAEKKTRLTSSKGKDQVTVIGSAASCSWRNVNQSGMLWIPLAGGALYVPEYLLLKAVVLLGVSHASKWDASTYYSIVNC